MPVPWLRQYILDNPEIYQSAWAKATSPNVHNAGKSAEAFVYCFLDKIFEDHPTANLVHTDKDYGCDFYFESDVDFDGAAFTVIHSYLDSKSSYEIGTPLSDQQQQNRTNIKGGAVCLNLKQLKDNNMPEGGRCIILCGNNNGVPAPFAYNPQATASRNAQDLSINSMMQVDASRWGIYIKSQEHSGYRKVARAPVVKPKRSRDDDGKDKEDRFQPQKKSLKSGYKNRWGN
jgi:hypothetical protein